MMPAGPFPFWRPLFAVAKLIWAGPGSGCIHAECTHDACSMQAWRSAVAPDHTIELLLVTAMAVWEGPEQLSVGVPRYASLLFPLRSSIRKRVF